MTWLWSASAESPYHFHDVGNMDESQPNGQIHNTVRTTRCWGWPGYGELLMPEIESAGDESFLLSRTLSPESQELPVSEDLDSHISTLEGQNRGLLQIVCYLSHENGVLRVTRDGIGAIEISITSHGAQDASGCIIYAENSPEPQESESRLDEQECPFSPYIAEYPQKRSRLQNNSGYSVEASYSPSSREEVLSHPETVNSRHDTISAAYPTTHHTDPALTQRTRLRRLPPP